MSPERKLFSSRRFVDAIFDRDELEKKLKIEPVKVGERSVAMGIFPGIDWNSRHMEFNAVVLGDDKVEVVKILTLKRGDATQGGQAQLISVGIRDEKPTKTKQEILVFRNVLKVMGQAGDEFDPTKSINPQNHLMKMMMSGVDFGHPYVEIAVMKVVPTMYYNF
jgi:hypothetical protein